MKQSSPTSSSYYNTKAKTTRRADEQTNARNLMFPREPILQHPRTKLLCFELKQSRPHLADTRGETLNVTERRLVTRHGVQIKLSSKNVASKKRSQISFHGDFVSTRIIYSLRRKDIEKGNELLSHVRVDRNVVH